MTLRETQLTGDGASGFLGGGGPSGDDLALGQPLNRRRPAQPYALGPGAGETGMDALLDNRAVELGEHTEHLKQGPAGRRRSIQTLSGSPRRTMPHIAAIPDGPKGAEKLRWTRAPAEGFSAAPPTAGVHAERRYQQTRAGADFLASGTNVPRWASS
jgi:hypothetical protein